MPTSQIGVIGKLFRALMAHKVLAGVAVLVVVGGGWWYYQRQASQAAAETRYVLGVVEKKTIVSVVSASGQISASNQLDVKTKAGGEVVYVGITPGQYVRAGTLLVQLDDTDAQKTVRDAKANLESANISLEKLQQPPTQLTLTQAQNSLKSAQGSLDKLYSDTHTDVVNVFTTLPDVMNNLEQILTGNNAGGSSFWNIDFYKAAIEPYDDRAQTYRDQAYNDFLAAKKSYQSSFALYQSLGSSPDNATMEQALNQVYGTLQLTSKALKSGNALIQLYIDVYKGRTLTPVSAAGSGITGINTYTTSINNNLFNLLSDINGLTENKRSIVEKQQSLDQVKAGADALDIRSSQLSVTKAQNSLTDAQNALADYYVRAPFDGTIAAVNLKKHDTAGSGSTAVTLITSQKVAELSLNEVDAAKINVGDKATLTFDALPDLTLTGAVAEIDTIGTVSQGVVSYTIKIGFDSQDARVKSGMTVNAAIQTDVRQDVLAVPAGAVKTQNGQSYVLVFDPPLTESGGTQGVSSDAAPVQTFVTIGISDDTNIEIVSGLTEGVQIVTRTISQSTTQTQAASTPSLFGGGGGSVRVGGAGR